VPKLAGGEGACRPEELECYEAQLVVTQVGVPERRHTPLLTLSGAQLHPCGLVATAASQRPVAPARFV
jgi:hypothetical protein